MTNQDIASRAGFCVVQGGRDDRQHFYVWHNDVPAALGKERSKEAAWALAATFADFFAPRDPEAQLYPMCDHRIAPVKPRRRRQQVREWF